MPNPMTIEPLPPLTAQIEAYCAKRDHQACMARVKLGGMRREVYEYLAEHGGMTTRELAEAFCERRDRMQWVVSGIIKSGWARFDGPRDGTRRYYALPPRTE